MNESSEESTLLQQARDGDSRSLGELFELHRDRLTRVVSFRMDGRLRGRIDAADVVQEGFLVSTKRFPEYAVDMSMPFFLWLRFLVLQKMNELQRHHLGVKARDVSREVSLFQAPYPNATSAVIADQLLGKHTTPSQAITRDEVRRQLQQALEDMDDTDREMVALRHFEQLTNVETAKVLGIKESAASNRYVRAMKRLKKILDQAN